MTRLAQPIAASRACGHSGCGFGMSEIGLLLGATTKDMPEHIRGGATRQRTDFAISLRDGADLGPMDHGGLVEKSLWWLAPRRFPLLTQAQIRSRQSHNLNVHRPYGPRRL